jgi:hypothetical protein
VTSKLGFKRHGRSSSRARREHVGESSASAIVVTPARRMSSPVIPGMAAAVVPIGCAAAFRASAQRRADAGNPVHRDVISSAD